MLHLPHHDGSALFVPEQTPRLDDEIPLFVRVPHAYDVKDVHLRSLYDGEHRYATAVVDRVDEHETWYRVDLPVHNPSTPYRFLLDRGADGYAWLNAAGVQEHDVSDHYDFRALTYAPPPAWAQGAVIYQVFPDRFARSGRVADGPPDWAAPAEWSDPVVHEGPGTSRQLFGGDLWGVASRLDHLQALGADTLYLTPVFPARSNHRYDATTFDAIDPLLGGNEAFAHLARAVHARGMRLIGDLTTNHSGSGHEWFRRAVGDATSDEAAYYYFLDHPHEYAGWMGVKSLPKFDLNDEVLRRRLVDGPDSVIARWMQEPYDLDGWRIDAANVTGRYGSDDLTHDIARTIRATMDAVDPATFLLCEHTQDASGDLRGDGWQANMNYSGFTRPVWSWLSTPTPEVRFLGMPTPVRRVGGGPAVASMREFAAAVPWRLTSHNVNLLGSHDTPRPRTVMGGSAERLRIAAAWLFTYPGVPMVFMGDEFGLTGLDGEHSRTPMPWDEPAQRDESVLAAYRSLIALRRSSPALRSGGLRWVHAGDDAIAFLRETAEERILVLLTRAPWSGIALPASVLPPGGRAEALYGDGLLAAGPERAILAADTAGAWIWRLP